MRIRHDRFKLSRRSGDQVVRVDIRSSRLIKPLLPFPMAYPKLRHINSKIRKEAKRGPEAIGQERILGYRAPPRKGTGAGRESVGNNS